MTRAVGLLDRTVISARALTPLLTASDDLLEVYARVTAVANHGERRAQYGRGFLEAHNLLVEAQLRGVAIDYRTKLPFGHAWRLLRDEYPHLMTALERLDRVAAQVLGADATGSRSPEAPHGGRA